jgi:hypothetical protein
MQMDEITLKKRIDLCNTDTTLFVGYPGGAIYCYSLKVCNAHQTG